MNTNPAQRVAVLDAATRLDELVERVQRGDRIVITRNGVPVARLVPCLEPADHEGVEAAVRGLLAFDGPALPPGVTLPQLIAEGRS